MSLSTELPQSSTTFPKCESETRRFWYAVRVRPHWEKFVSNALRTKRYDEFLPLYHKRREWSDREKNVDVPLFPGYVFCRPFSSDQPLLVTTPGVIGILRFGAETALVSDDEIEAIKRILRSGACVKPWPYLKQGTRCRVTRGTLTGVEGILIYERKDCRVVLSVEALCRSVSVEIDRDCVMPTSPGSTVGRTC